MLNWNYYIAILETIQLWATPPKKTNKKKKQKNPKKQSSGSFKNIFYKMCSQIMNV